MGTWAQMEGQGKEVHQDQGPQSLCLDSTTMMSASFMSTLKSPRPMLTPPHFFCSQVIFRKIVCFEKKKAVIIKLLFIAFAGGRERRANARTLA